MTQAEFEAALRRDGFAEIATGEMKPNEKRPAHSHDYAVRALVTHGDISLDCAGGRRRYGVGDVFTLAAGEEHAEAIGESGVRYIVGRRR
jgi:quercetin dioxygenase-like cupin family protein